MEKEGYGFSVKHIGGRWDCRLYFDGEEVWNCNTETRDEGYQKLSRAILRHSEQQ